MRNRFPTLLHAALLALLALAPLAGCEETPAWPDRTSLPIMPLAVGNMWIGRSYGLDSLGGPTGVEPDTLSIVASESIGGETWYRTSDGGLMANRSDGLWVRAAAGAEPLQVAKHPAEVGQIFGRDTLPVLYTDTLDHEIDSVVFSRIIVAVGTGLKVTAGTYRVTGYENVVETVSGRRIADTSELWSGDVEYYAPGVGRVQQHIYAASPSGKVLWRVWELVEARLK